MSQTDPRELMVTIRCLVYNHEPYLRQCLDGFVMQKTNFRFEAIVHDDASTDGSADIIREYAAKYPDIIKPIIEAENQYSKRDGSLGRIMNAHTHGKYVALCEGDDYWIDPLKLQKQVDFLEKNPEYSMCFGRAREHFDDICKEEQIFSLIEDRDYGAVEIFEKWIVATATVVYRKEVLKSKIYTEQIFGNKNLIYGDIPLFLCCSVCGKVRGLNDVFSVYNRHSGGVTRIHKSSKVLEKRMYHVMEMKKIFSPLLDSSSKKLICYYGCLSFLKSFFERGTKIKFSLLVDSMKISLLYTCQSLWKIILRIN